MQGNYIEAQDILKATNGGLDIIFQLYPQAVGSDLQKNRKFKIRTEGTSSCSLKKADDGNWLVTDFGGDSKPRNAIQCYMEERSLSWLEAIRQLAANFNVVSADTAAQILRATYSERAAEPEDIEGKWTWEVRNNLSDIEIETIVSTKVLSYLGWKKPVSTSTVSEDGKLNLVEEERIMAPYNKIKAVFQEYHWHPLVSYSIVKNRKVMTFSSTEQYPIFLIDEGTHQKIYQPLNPDKAFRFMYAGTKPKDFIHGLAQLTKLYKERKKQIEEDDSWDEMVDDEDNPSKKKKKESPKIDEAILCTGGSDGLNVALMGYRVLWLNSETAKLHQRQYDDIMIMVEKLYQLPDIDLTGKRVAHELAMKYLEIFTITLPEELKKYRDRRNNECKDVRDYLNHYFRKDFKLLVETAMPYRFWDKKAKYEGRGKDSVFVGYDYIFNNVYGYNFLSKNGFGRLLTGDQKTDWIFVHNQNGVVREVDSSIIEDFIHDFLEGRFYDIELRNKMHKSTQLNASSLAKIKKVEIDFSNNTPTSQFFFFQNKTVEITADGLTYHKAGTINKHIWEEDLLQHRIEPLKAEPFTITKNEFNELDIEIHDKECPFFKYLVQTSRVHWRKELEERTAIAHMTAVEAEEYAKVNHCVIDGPNLSPEEIEEQKAHLINKIFSIGFLLHRYKARDKGWFVWGMDNKINDDGLSHGGSGKSLLFDLAMRAMLPKSFVVNGRNPKLTDDTHKYEGVTEHTPYMLIDDGHEYLKLEPFYPDITGDMEVNPKGIKKFSIPFRLSPKIAFTSNYVPKAIAPSTERRMIYAVFSDYFHNKGENDDYRERRDPVTDLGLKLFDDFTDAQWNSFYNLMMYCVKFYLGTSEKMKPAMENVNKRNLLSSMGNVHDWASVYFSESAGRLDTMCVREEAYKDYILYNGKAVTPQSFSSRLRDFCRYYGYTYNPKEYQDKLKKIIRKVPAKVYISSSNTWEPIPNVPKVPKEMIYIQAADELPSEVDEISAPAGSSQASMDMPQYVPSSGDEPGF